MRPPIARPKGWRPHEAKRRDYDAARGTARQRGYDSAWQRVRAAHLARHPKCCVPGCQTPHDRLNVDHIVSVRECPSRRLDPTNLRTMCQSHHSSRTSRDHSWNGGRG
ncbi:HNH endonuclease signature motif containing protein [Gluconobacter cerinus]